MNPLLQIKNLQIEFTTGENQLVAVNGISFSVEKGETVAVVGESGSGKSITALSVMRLLPAQGRITRGEILYHRQNQITDLLCLSEKSMPAYRGKEIAMIFQEPMTSLNPVYTCGYQVVEAIQLHLKKNYQQARELTLSLFSKVKLPDPLRIFSAYPHQLSGGQKQRVMIAMAMSCNPELLIADEPTTALDVTVQARILELLKDLQQQRKMSMIFISHDLEVVSNLCDRVVVMFKGTIVEQGPTRELFSNPKHPYTQSLLACKPPLNKRLRRLPVISDFMDERETGEMISKKAVVSDVILKYELGQREFTAREKFIEKQPPVLSVQNVSVRFPVRRNFFGKTLEWVNAVDDISFEVRKGETLGLVGESGCGKTTLGRTILQLIPATSGKIFYDQKELTSLPKKEMRRFRKRLQIIFQDPYASLNPRLTIGYAITEPLRAHRIGHSENERRKKVFDLLDKVQLSKESYSRYPHEFSGGQRQRICIARALAVEPEFIVCDECVSALDVSVQAQVLNLLKDLQNELGLTYIFISHDLSVVKFMSDHMLVMNKGRIEELGQAEKIYRNPSSAYTRELIHAIPSFNSPVLNQVDGRTTLLH